MIFENDALTFQLLDVLRLQNTCEAQVHRENRGDTSVLFPSG